MIRRWPALLVLSLAALFTASPPVHAQGQYVSGSITVVDGGTCSTASAFVLMNLSGGSASVAINVSGTFSATLSFVTTVDTAANYTAVNAYPPNSTTAVTSTTGAGTWTVSVPGMASLCVYASAYASGTAVVAMRSTAAISASTRGGGGGGGSGTVSGQANGVIPLGTTATSITQQSHLDDGVTTASTIHSSENVSVAGSGTFSGGVTSTTDGVHNGQLSMVGNTADAAVPSNTVGWGGPNTSATGTAYRCDLPWANPSGNQLLECPTPSAGVSTGAWVNNSTVVNGQTCTLGSTCGTPLTYFQVNNPSPENASLTLSGANAINWQPMTIPAQGLTVTHLTFLINTQDATAGHHYDICVWNSSGTLVADLGAHAGGSGWVNTQYQNDVAIAQTSVFLPGGLYFYGWTGDATTLQLSSPLSGAYTVQLYGTGPVTTSTAGQCPNVTVPSPSVTNNTGGIYEGLNMIFH